MSNEDIEANVSDELLWDPKVDPGEIAVFADDGVVTLRGTVGSFRMKREAKQDAERVYGVKSVHNELQVRILDDDRRDDADLRGAVLQAPVAGQPHSDDGRREGRGRPRHAQREGQLEVPA